MGLRLKIEEKSTQLVATSNLAGGIARIVVMIGDEPTPKPLIDMPRMAEKTVDELHQSLDALINLNAGGQIATEDDDMDYLYSTCLAVLCPLSDASSLGTIHF